MRPLLVAILLLAGSARSQAQPLISPRVRLVADGHLPASTLGSSANPLAFITARIAGGAERLRTLGFVASPLGGDVAGLQVDVAELRRLLQAPGLLQVDERRILRPQLDMAAAAIGAPAARAQSGLDGSGVLVGVIDTGADPRHADLRDSNGQSDIEALLDLSLPDNNKHPEIGSWGGAVWLRDDINAALSAEDAGMSPPFPLDTEDVAGHGTHVSGIALSTGLATGKGFPSGRYVGIAPGAHLLAVKATRDNASFLDADLLTACRFQLARAQALGRPLVVNLSLAGAGGPHDGSTNLEQALDALFPTDQSGLVLVAAAGNEGLTDRHAAGWALDGRVDVPVQLTATFQNGGEVAIDVFSSQPISLSVVTPSGKVVGPVLPGNSGHDDDGAGGTVAIDQTSPIGSDGRLQSGIVLIGAGSVPPAGSWHIRLQGQTARWDGFITETPDGLPNTRFTDHISEDDRLTIPGTASSAITVGSFISRSGWVTIDGDNITRDVTVGDASLFSSAGPSADGRFVPDLSAPGQFIISSLSAAALPNLPTSDFFVGATMPDFAWADDGQHGVLQGTSQAAPFVAGSVALLLQLDPTLTATQIRELLRATARDSGAGWSPRLGFGTLDVQALLDAARGRWGSSLDVARSSVGVSLDALPPGDGITLVTVTPRDSQGRPLGPGHNVAVSVSAGALSGAVSDLGQGRYEQAVIAHAARGQVGAVSATVDGVALSAHPNIYFVDGRDEIGQPFRAGGGCSPFGPPSSVGFALLLLATLLWARRSKRLRG